MTPKQKLFCEYYCGKHFGNALQAAIEAGYSREYAKAKAHKLLRKPEISEYIEQLIKPVRKKRIATVDEIKAFFTDIMEDTEQATKDRIRAAELLAKTAGAFRDDW